MHHGETRSHDGRLLEGKAATQERILQAAGRLFLEHGYESTTVADVAREAGVSRATVFWHFSDKPSLFREAFARLLVPFHAALQRDLSHLEPRKRLRERVALYDAFVTQRRSVIRGFMRWAIESPEFRDSIVATLMTLHRRYTTVLAGTLAEILPPQEDAEALAGALMAMLDGNLLLTVFDPTPDGESGRRASVEALLDVLPLRRELDRG